MEFYQDSPTRGHCVPRTGGSAQQQPGATQTSKPLSSRAVSLSVARSAFSDGEASYRQGHYLRAQVQFETAESMYRLAGERGNERVAARNVRLSKCNNLIEVWKDDIIWLKELRGESPQRDVPSLSDDHKGVCVEFPGEMIRLSSMIDALESARRQASPTPASPQDTPRPQRRPRQACANAYSTTTACATTSKTRADCVRPPVQTGDVNRTTGLQNYTVSVGLACSGESYFAVVESYGPDGTCTREVVRLSPLGTATAQVESSKQPRVIDQRSGTDGFGSAVSSAQIFACYKQRHQGCACGTSP